MILRIYLGNFGQYHFSMNEYSVNDVQFNQTITCYDMPVPVPRFPTLGGIQPKIGKLTGNYSTLLIKFTLLRYVRIFKKIQMTTFSILLYLGIPICP